MLSLNDSPFALSFSFFTLHTHLHANTQLQPRCFTNNNGCLSPLHSLAWQPVVGKFSNNPTSLQPNHIKYNTQTRSSVNSANSAPFSCNETTLDKYCRYKHAGKTCAHTYSHWINCTNSPELRQSASSSLLQPAELAPTLTTITTIVNNPQYVFTWGFQKPEKKKKEWGEKKKTLEKWRNVFHVGQSAGTLMPYCVSARICFGLLWEMRLSRAVDIHSISVDSEFARYVFCFSFFQLMLKGGMERRDGRGLYSM